MTKCSGAVNATSPFRQYDIMQLETCTTTSTFNNKDIRQRLKVRILNKFREIVWSKKSLRDQK